MIEHCSNNVAKWLIKTRKLLIADNLSKWLSEPRKWLSVQGCVGSIRARLGPGARGQRGAHRVSNLRESSVAHGLNRPIGWLAGPLDGTIGPSPRVMNNMYIYTHTNVIHHIGWSSPTQEWLTKMSAIQDFCQPFQTTNIYGSAIHHLAWWITYSKMAGKNISHSRFWSVIPDQNILAI
jgi:hypothetical protein